jgi:hypothetical protein
MARSDTGIASWTMLLWVPQTVDPFLGGLSSRCRMRSRISSSESEDMVIEIHYLNLNLTHAVPTSEDGLKNHRLQFSSQGYSPQQKGSNISPQTCFNNKFSSNFIE